MSGLQGNFARTHVSIGSSQQLARCSERQRQPAHLAHHAQQTPVLNFDKRFALCICSVQAGKDLEQDRQLQAQIMVRAHGGIHRPTADL
eukprot:50783-Pleurochrysis_carterae.AAC.1